MHGIYLLLLLLTYSKCSVGETKIWIPNTNFNNKKNWADNKLPCESNIIKFPEELGTAVYFPTKVEVGEIILPDNGELLLNVDGYITIRGNRKTPNCANNVAQFNNMIKEPWLNPTNWKTEETSTNEAKPHAERLPCVYDDVVFPNDSTYWVQYPEIPISVNSLKVREQNMTNYQLQEYFVTKSGYREFENLDYQTRTDVITVENNKCTDISGCACQTNEDIFPFVCFHSVDLCEIPYCLTPVRPVGHCCEICGSFLLLEYKSNFDLNSMRNEVKKHLYLTKQKTVVSYASKVTHNHKTYIQVVFVEPKTFQGESINAASDFHEKIMSKPEYYKISISKLFASGERYLPGTQAKITLGIVFGTLLGVLMFFIIMFFLTLTPLEKKYFKKPSRFPFADHFIFARFENSPDGDLEFRSHSVASSITNLDRAFENPMYEQCRPSSSGTAKEDIKMQEKMSYLPSSALYSELQRQDSVETQESEE